uniref:NADH-ubiquinone oxidoreductase chain 5 n=1 Tax=Kleidocerys resedae resedae TaxID=1503485 RepID=A0A060BJ84_9HEMI|nr:NADH dehydrogenase subunit 5 [Kleidocerys resedae resedae]
MLLNYYYWFWFFLILGVSFYFLGFIFVGYDYSFLIDWDMITLNSCSLVMTLIVDWMSLFFVGSVMLISSMVILYSMTYMIDDINKLRFLFIVVLFIISMCLMILSPNLISILLGWDGLGLVSYCLVIYYQNFNSYNAGMLTIMINRLGDVAILLGICVLFNSGGWYFLFYNFIFYSWGSILIFLIVLASFTSSAQVPFSSWLPAAMAAPTPVSSLVHSSTLVTSGVYLMIRFKDFIYGYDTLIFLFFSVMTMFFSGICANYEYDIKKIIALSTLSQLGLMMSIFFMGYSVLSFFHLLTHAFFKALLFLCGGLIIHSVNDCQDIRYMGGLGKFLPYTMTCFGIANFSLCGLPFLSGFYSKDMILEFASLSYFNLFIYIIFYFSVGLTACYSFRLLYYVVFNDVNLMVYGNYCEDTKMMISMIFLSFMSIVKGSFFLWCILPYPSLFVCSFLISVMPLIFIMFGGFLGIELSFLGYFDYLYGLKYNFIFYFMNFLWFMPLFSGYFVSFYSLYSSVHLSSLLEFGWGEFLISNSLFIFIRYMSVLNSYYQNNNLKIHYCMFLLISLFLFVI